GACSAACSTNGPVASRIVFHQSHQVPIHFCRGRLPGRGGTGQLCLLLGTSQPHHGPDRRPGPANGGKRHNISSIASTGFGLTALCIADHRGWHPAKEIRDRVRTTLRFALQGTPHEHGFLYHFIDAESGQRVWKCELSSIDTCLFLCGALTCRAYFQDVEIRDLATQLYERVDWAWMMNGGKTLSMGWFPDKGFLAARWDSYCELMML